MRLDPTASPFGDAARRAQVPAIEPASLSNRAIAHSLEEVQVDPLVELEARVATFELYAAALQARLESSRLFDDRGELAAMREQLVACTAAIGDAARATLAACRDGADLLPVGR